MKNLKRFLFVVSFLFFFIILLSVGYFHFIVEANFGPVVFLDHSEIDFGIVIAGEPCTKEITITNNGWTALNILQVKPGCAGCITIRSYPKKTIVAGQSDVVCFDLETASLYGEIVRSFAIISNDKNNPAAIIQVKANVKSPIKE